MTVHLELSQQDQQRLQGAEGKSLQFAMTLLKRVADCTDADQFIDISQTHLVGSYYGGPADLALIKKLSQLNAKVVVPTTLSASASDIYQQSIDTANNPDDKANCQLVKLYQAMGCQVELTCAPYHLPTIPLKGDNIAWAESNAIVYANSVIGARTNKTFQYLDLCAALTGRMPNFGLYKTANRRARIIINLEDMPDHWLRNDVFFQLLGYLIGKQCGQSIPVINNLPPTASHDNLRSLGASAASTGSINMFHAVGLTPESNCLEDALQRQTPDDIITFTSRDILHARDNLCHHRNAALSAVCLGTPHFSYLEFQQVLTHFDDRKVHPSIDFFISTSRHVYKQLHTNGELQRLLNTGLKIVTDSCTYYGLLLKDKPGTVMTASGKWAYYSPGNLNVEVLLASVAECIESAIAGQIIHDTEFWAYE